MSTGLASGSPRVDDPVPLGQSTLGKVALPTGKEHLPLDTDETAGQVPSAGVGLVGRDGWRSDLLWTLVYPGRAPDTEPFPVVGDPQVRSDTPTAAR